MNNSINLSKIRAVPLDMDDVIYVGDSPLPGTQAFLDYLETTNRQWLCAINNSSKTPELFVEKLRRMDIRAIPENVLGSAQATAAWLAEQTPMRNGTRGKVVVIGEEGVASALEENLFEITEDPNEAQFVVSGIHFSLNL